VSGNNGTEVVPMLPDFLSEDEMENFWAALSWFFPPELIQEWRQAATEPGDVMTNKVVIGASLNGTWAHGEIAFRPLQLSHDANDLHLQFFQLSHTKSADDILEYRPPDSRRNRIFDVRRDSFPVVQSENILHLHSVDHTRYPLPNYHLLGLQWHLTRALRACRTPELLRILFDDSDYDGRAERENYKPRSYDPCARHTPWLSHFLIDSAVEERIIRGRDVPIWKETLDPDGELRAEGKGWVYYRSGGWEYVVDHSNCERVLIGGYNNPGVEWEYVAGYDKDGNRVNRDEEDELIGLGQVRPY